MWKNNRPEGWDKTVKDLFIRFADGKTPFCGEELKLIEAGADAILKALKKTGYAIKNREAYCCPCQVCNTGEDCIATEDGVIVFIPD